jgi:UDP-N-acetylmuramoylalanine--D-glutamate ligase
MDLQNKKIAVLGMGKDGISLLLALAKKGSQVTGFGSSVSENQKKEVKKTFDALPVKLHWGDVPKDELLGFDLIVFSSRSGHLNRARNFAKLKGVPVLSDLDFVNQCILGPVVGVTGTNGKTTTMSLLRKIFETGGLQVSCTGGEFDEWGKRISDPKKYNYHLFELSSIRLENSDNFSPHIAVLLNIFPAHGGRHKDGIVGYIEAKSKVFSHQGPEDYLVHEASAVNVRELIRSKKPKSRQVMFSLENPVEAPGVYLDKDQLVWLGLDGSRETFPLAKAPQRHSAYLLNFMAALAVARLCGVEAKVIQSVLESFKNLPYRLEKIRTAGGVNFINDARSTNLGATLWAISSFQRPIWLIMGGAMLPDTDFELLRRMAKNRVKGILIVGNDKEVLAEKLKGASPVVLAKDLKEATELAYKKAKEKDVILFSPACPPDIYTQGEGTERGEEFTEIVLKLPDIPRKIPKTTFTRI